MIEAYYGLSAAPFRLAPEPRFFFASTTHRKALSYLDYGLRQGEGFLVLSGEIGAGKSLLVAHLLAGLGRESVSAVSLASGGLEPLDALWLIAEGLGLEPSGTGKAPLLAAIRRCLVEQERAGRRVLLVVDEAQSLPVATFEELRLLTDLGSGARASLQCFLVGQPQLRPLIARPELEQLRQRVVASCHLEPLAEAETGRYVRHRLEIAGWRGAPVLAEGVGAAVHAATGGVPRRINLLCGRLMLLGAVEGRERLDEADVSAVLADLRAEGLATAPVATTDAGPPAGNGAMAARLEELEDLVRETRGMMAALVRPRGRDGGGPS
jgi:type II secretory pathway predicted ATPase ExeA